MGNNEVGGGLGLSDQCHGCIGSGGGRAGPGAEMGTERAGVHSWWDKLIFKSIA